MEKTLIYKKTSSKALDPFRPRLLWYNLPQPEQHLGEGSSCS